jgi:outer membrane lipoprotein-sorting protein
MKMRSIVALLLAVALVFTMAMVAGAQEKKKEAGERISGTIQTIDRATKTVTVRQSSGNAQRQVVYTDDTQITNQNKPGGTVDQLKDGVRIICVGKFNAKAQLVAERIDIRLPR